MVANPSAGTAQLGSGSGADAAALAEALQAELADWRLRSADWERRFDEERLRFDEERERSRRLQLEVAELRAAATTTTTTRRRRRREDEGGSGGGGREGAHFGMPSITRPANVESVGNVTASPGGEGSEGKSLPSTPVDAEGALSKNHPGWGARLFGSKGTPATVSSDGSGMKDAGAGDVTLSDDDDIDDRSHSDLPTPEDVRHLLGLDDEGKQEPGFDKVGGNGKPSSIRTVMSGQMGTLRSSPVPDPDPDPAASSPQRSPDSAPRGAAEAPTSASELAAATQPPSESLLAKKAAASYPPAPVIQAYRATRAVLVGRDRGMGGGFIDGGAEYAVEARPVAKAKTAAAAEAAPKVEAAPKAAAAAAAATRTLEGGKKVEMRGDVADLIQLTHQLRKSTSDLMDGGGSGAPSGSKEDRWASAVRAKVEKEEGGAEHLRTAKRWEEEKERRRLLKEQEGEFGTPASEVASAKWERVASLTSPTVPGDLENDDESDAMRHSRIREEVIADARRVLQQRLSPMKRDAVAGATRTARSVSPGRRDRVASSQRKGEDGAKNRRAKSTGRGLRDAEEHRIAAKPSQKVDQADSGIPANVDVTGKDAQEGGKVVTETIRVIIKTMKERPNSLSTQRQGCEQLSKLAVYTKNAETISKCGGIPVVIYASVRHGIDPVVQVSSIGILWNLARRDEENKATIGLFDGAAAMLGAMKNHANHQAIIENACGCLWVLACRSEPNKACIFESGGLKVLAHVMNKYKHVASIQEHVAGVFWNMCWQNADRRVAVRNVGAIPLVIAAMKKHVKRVGVAEQCAGALWNASLDQENRTAVLNAGGIDAVLDTMEQHELMPQICEHSIGCLWLLSMEDVGALAIVNSRGVSAIVNCASKHMHVAGVIEEACGALSSLAAFNNPRGKNCVDDSGGFSFCISAMKDHSLNPIIQEHSALALMRLASGAQSRDEMYRFKKNKEVLEAAKKRFPEECEENVVFIKQKFKALG